MQTIANFAYAGKNRFVSHVVDGDKTLCGMLVKELLKRGEWEFIDHEEKFLGRVIPEPAIIGCKKCSRLLVASKNKGDSMTDFQEKVLAIIRSFPNQSASTIEVAWSLPQWKNRKGHAGVVSAVRRAWLALADAGHIRIGYETHTHHYYAASHAPTADEEWTVNCVDCNAEAPGATAKHCAKCGDPMCADCHDLKEGVCDSCYDGS